MHHILQKRKDFNLIFNFFFKIPKFAIESKKKIFFSKKIRFVFNENTDQFYLLKNLELYLIKIQISFMCKKKSDLYLMKIQINFYVLKKSDLHLMKMQISFWS